MIRPFDYAVFLVALVIVGAVGARAFSQPAAGALVRVQRDADTWLYSLDAEREVQPLPQDGTCVIRIVDGTARVVRSDCPQRICMSMGAISAAGEWIACLPHGIFISIEGNSAAGAVDGVAF